MPKVNQQIELSPNCEPANGARYGLIVAMTGPARNPTFHVQVEGVRKPIRIGRGFILRIVG